MDEKPQWHDAGRFGFIAGFVGTELCASRVAIEMWQKGQDNEAIFYVAIGLFPALIFGAVGYAVAAGFSQPDIELPRDVAQEHIL